MQAHGPRTDLAPVILVNSNPATIMTDPGLADATYIEPITPEVVAKIIEKERPDALLPTMSHRTRPSELPAFQPCARRGQVETFGRHPRLGPARRFRLFGGPRRLLSGGRDVLGQARLENFQILICRQACGLDLGKQAFGRVGRRPGP